MNKLPILFFVIVCAVSMVYFVVRIHKENQENINWHFNGIVENVRYDQKDIPYVQVNGKEYYLAARYKFDRKIAKGDSISKSKGSTVYKLTKPSGEVIIFEN